MLQEFPPIDKPMELFIQYIMNVYELKIECDKDIASFENLLTSWELNIIRQLHTSKTSSFAFGSPATAFSMTSKGISFLFLMF